MKNILYKIVVSVGLFLGAFGIAWAAGLTVPQGGTGWTGFVAGTIPIGPGTGTTALRFATSTGFTFATSTNTLSVTYASTTALSGTSLCLSTDCRTSWPTAGTFSWTPTTNYGVAVNATTTPIWFQAGLMASTTSYFVNATSSLFTVTGSTYLSSITSALVLTGADGLVAEYTGTSCTNQFVRSLSALGVATCASINNGDWSGTDLSVANGGTGLSTFGGTNTILYTTAADTLSSEAAFTYDPATNKLTADYASTTAVSASGAAYVPALNGCPSSSASGFSSVCLDTTAKQLQVTNGSDLYALSATSSRGFNIASTSLDAMGKSFNTATSSFLVINNPEQTTLLGFYCVASTTGTALVRLGDGVNWTETSTCTSGGYTVTATNNTFTAFEGLVVQASSTAGAVSRITVTPVWKNTAQ